MKRTFTRELIPLKNALKELEWVGEEGHDGPLIDLSVLLSKIVREFERKGAHYVLEKYGPELIVRPT
jgi:hypothetical protein